MRYSHTLHHHNQEQNPRKARLQRLLSLVFAGLFLIGLFVLNRYQIFSISEFFSNFLISLYRVVIAYFVSAAIGILLALLATKNALSESLLLPILDVSQSFPTFALVPLLVIIFGANSLSIITAIVFATMIWPMIFSLVSAIKTERLDLADAATIYGAKKGLKRLRNYRLPSILPAFLAGSIVAWGLGWDAVFGAEIIARVNGIGGYLGQFSYAGKAALLFLGIIIYLILIFVLNQLIWLPLLRLTTRYQSE